ncbi:MAG: hypothetical protein JXN62_00060 [Bacteroidales bacterium]|nr:hypothetical protein [Bacteroidales bacterium]
MLNKSRAIFLIFLIFPFAVFGQKMVNSPFARFNLGIFEPAGSFRTLGMGGTSIGMRDNNTLYFTNPASYSSLDTNSFVFDFGLDYGVNILSDGETRHTSDDMNFDHLLLGFPLARGWGIAAGIIPISNGYYKISKTIEEGDPDYDPLVGGYSEYHLGKGSFSNFFIGTGINFLKNFSAGVNMTLLFGSINRSAQFIFDDFNTSFHDNKSESYRMSGLNFEYGIQYAASLKKDYFFNLGASMVTGKDYKSTYENLIFTYNFFGTTDTLSLFLDESSRSSLPATMSLGLSFGKKNKFVAGADYIATNWSEAAFQGSEGYVADTRAILLGFEYIPDKYSNYSLLRRMEYRIGGHLKDNYLIINGEQIKEIGFSIGVGVPLRRTLSKANVFVDFTKRSGESDAIHSENCITIGASINLYDQWFIKRKYD